MEIVLFGVVISAVVFAFMCKFMDYSLQKEGRLYKKFLWFLKYGVILICEIVKANLAVLKLLFMSEYELEPVLVSFKTPVKNRMAQVILANSITLTPGTITVGIEEDQFLVHCLDSSLAVGLDSSVFVKELKKFEEVR